MIKIQDLAVKNPWWGDKTAIPVEINWPKRELYGELVKNLEHPLMLNLVGLRRVGKSTILRQIIGLLLTQKKDPQKIFYFLFDYASQPQKEQFLEEVLNGYFQDVLGAVNLALDEQVWVFLDEIQYIENWQAVLKKFYDLSGKKIKFVVTGSQSVLLKGKHRESLAGRIFDFYLSPLSFREFVLLKNAKSKLLEKFDLFDLSQQFGKLAIFENAHGKELAKLAQQYLTTGQFPETQALDEIEKKHEYISQSVLGKVLDDCVRIFKIEKSYEFKLVAYQLLNNAGSVFELKNISREVGLSMITLEKYFEYLKEAYVIEVLFRKHKSLIKRGRMLKKIYTPCVNFVCALNHYGPEQVEKVPEAFGKIVENAVYNTFKQKYPSSEMINSLSFWRRGEKEVDFLVESEGGQLAIEVKFSNKVTLQDSATLVDYAKKSKPAFSIMVTKNEFERKEIAGEIIYFMPYYLVLLLV
ncbi:MAG: ATP-binding protein [Candidatus Moraniibacteriota bacterium]